MHIFHVNDGLIFGGIPSAKLVIARSLRTVGIESSFWFRSVADKAVVAPFENEFPTYIGPRPLLRSVIVDNAFDVIHVTIWTMYFALPAILSCGFDGPVVLSSHQGTKTDPIHPRVDHLLSVSEAGRACIVDPFQRPCEVIHNGVDPYQFSVQREDPLTLVGPIPTGERPIVLWIGRVCDWRKNFPGLLGASQAIREAGCDIWALHSDDYPAACQLESTVGRGRFVMTHGVPFDRMPDVFGLVRDSGGCYWLNSFTESCPNAILQAMSSGCPVVAARVGGVPELIDHDVHGWLYDVDAPIESVLELIMDAIRGNARSANVTRARERILADFSISRVAERYANLYRRLVTEPGYRHPLSSRQKSVRAYLRLGRVLPFLIPVSRWT
jgi:glycosyltransferase involved in cell wall biosynthesis